MIVLRPTQLHWLEPLNPDPADLCAHSPVEFRIGDATIVAPDHGDWTVSASALYLLRTLSSDHTKQSPVGDHLFPCCGFAMFDVDDSPDVIVLGCLSGVDVEVATCGQEVSITTQDRQVFRVGVDDWRAAILGFSATVRAFYDSEPGRRPGDAEDAKGFAKFMKEWDRRTQSNLDRSRGTR